MVLTTSFATIPAWGLGKAIQLVAILTLTSPGKHNFYHMSEKQDVYFTIRKVRQRTLKFIFPLRMGLSDGTWYSDTHDLYQLGSH